MQVFIVCKGEQSFYLEIEIVLRTKHATGISEMLGNNI